MEIIIGDKATRREWIGLAVLALPCLLYSMDLTVLLLAVPHLGEERWPEPAITAHLKSSGARWDYIELPQVGQVLKEKKRGFWNGAWARTRMYADLLTFRARRKRP